MRKNFLALLFGVAALVCCAFGLSACGSSCDGEYSDMTVYEQSPTCTKKGINYHVYCPKCNKYWTSPGHKKETSPDQNVLPALGHSYSGGKCIRCGKTDPELLPDTLQIPDLNISAAGVLSWGGIKVASKYRVEITDEDSVKHVYDISDSEETALDLTNLSDEYALAYGKNYASITAYKPYSENIGGETISDDIPVTESKTDFIAIKQNSGYSFTQLTYADEYITVNGAYADMRSDGDKSYILLEQQMGADKQTVGLNIANKVKKTQGVILSFYKDEEKKESLSSGTLYYPAGATDIYVTANGASGVRNYVIRVLAIKPVEINLIRAEKSGSGYTFTTLMDHITVLENDYIDVNMFYSTVSSSSEVVVGADFKVYNKGSDCVMPLCLGKSYNFYVVGESYLNNVNADLQKYGDAFNCNFVWGDNGSPSYWTLSLRYDYNKKAVYVPAYFGNNDVVVLTTNTLGYDCPLEKVVFGSGFTGLTSAVFQGCTQLKEVYIPNTAKDGLGDFLFPAALKDNLTVYFEGEISNDRWNQISGGGFKYFTTVKNTPLPTYEQIMK